MKNNCLNRNCETRSKYNFATAGIVFFASALLAGCSSVPDWANPVEWFNSASQVITGDEKPEAISSKLPKAPKTGAATNKIFPNLGSVPVRPTYAEKAERKTLVERLEADRESAKYSRESIRQDGSKDIAPPTPSSNVQMSSVIDSVSAGRGVAAARPASAVQSPPLAAKSVPVITSQLDPLLQPNRPNFSTSIASTGSTMSQDGSVRSLIRRPIPGTRSVSRVGNPSFGPPPPDIAEYLGAGLPSATTVGTRDGKSNSIPDTQFAVPALTGKPVGIFHFSAGSANLSDRERIKLRKLVQAYRQRGGGVRVEGHSSSRTRDMDLVQHHLVNFNVSMNRCNTVARELINSGVPAEAVSVIALSDSRPLYAEVMPAGDAGNQRVEVYFVN